MEPIVGIVDHNDVPPTLGIDRVGLVLRFFKHNPVFLVCTRSVVLELINNLHVKKNEILYPGFRLKIGKNRITLLLSTPISGHGTARFKKDEFLSLLKG